MAVCQIIGVVGGSGSGKTWLARHLQAKLGPSCGHLSLDDFYQDLSHLPAGERALVNFDDPCAIDWSLLGEVLDRLEHDGNAPIPSYDFNTHCRLPHTRQLAGCRWLVVEGLWLLHEPWLREKLALSVYVDCPEDERLRRRIGRDVLERGRSEESVRKQFAEHVQPMHAHFVEPQRFHAMHCMTSPMSVEDCEALLASLRD